MKLAFNPVFDISPVDQVGFLDLRKAYESGVIEGNFNISDDSYNNASPDDLMHRPDDIFSGFRQRDYVKSALSVSEAQSQKSPE